MDEVIINVVDVGLEISFIVIRYVEMVRRNGFYFSRYLLSRLIYMMQRFWLHFIAFVEWNVVKRHDIKRIDWSNVAKVCRIAKG